MSLEKEQMWYLIKKSHIQGPYSCTEIAKFVVDEGCDLESVVWDSRTDREMQINKVPELLYAVKVLVALNRTKKKENLVPSVRPRDTKAQTTASKGYSVKKHQEIVQKNKEQQWYVEKGSRVQGPYSVIEVGQYLLLDRIRNTDRVSRDGELWEPVTQVPELIPEELLDLDSGKSWQFMALRENACLNISVYDEKYESGTNEEPVITWWEKIQGNFFDVTWLWLWYRLR